MGRVLSIRLSAVTYNEEDVFRAWPGLCALAWPGAGEVANGVWKPQAKAFAAPVPAAPVRRGVVELAHALVEEFTLGDMAAAVKEKLRDKMAELQNAAAKLETALGDWKPQDANTATNAIEDALDKLERSLA
ncbi:MAG: hypothetical protein DELT_00609 [Desulfovibrio sp.]